MRILTTAVLGVLLAVSLGAFAQEKEDVIPAATPDSSFEGVSVNADQSCGGKCYHEAYQHDRIEDVRDKDFQYVNWMTDYSKKAPQLPDAKATREGQDI